MTKKAVHDNQNTQVDISFLVVL